MLLQHWRKKKIGVNTSALAARGDLTGDEEQECNNKIMRCFRYYSSKNNQSPLHWLYPSTEMKYTSCKEVSNFPPSQSSAVSRHCSLLTLPAGFSTASHKDLRTSTLQSSALSTCLDISRLLALHSSPLAFSITSTEVGVPCTRPSSGDWPWSA